MPTRQAVPILAETPLFERYLLESPWLLMVVLALAGVVAMIVLRRSGKTKAGAGATVLGLVLAGIVFAIATLVTTAREELQRQTRDLVAAVAKADTGVLAAMLEPNARLVAPMGIPAASGRDNVLELVATYPGERYPIVSHSTSYIQAKIDGANVARSQLRVSVRVAKEQAFYDAPFGSWWLVYWRREREGAGGWGPWRVTTIEVLQLDGVGR